MLKPRQPLRIFLSHSSSDKPIVRALYGRLVKDGFAPWLDEEDLLPGQDWNQEIVKAIRNSDVVIVCLSKGSISKSGFMQKEIKFILDVSDEQPEGTIFLIPLKLEECDIPERLGKLHWVNFFEERGYERLFKALKQRAATIKKDPPKRSQLNSDSPPLNENKKTDGDEQAETVIGQDLETYHLASPIASWIFGGALLIFLFIVVFILPTPTQFQKDTIRFLMALAAAFFSLFFIGGVLLKGTLKGLFISATGGFVLFILIQFVFHPFKVAVANTTNPVPSPIPLSSTNPVPISIATPQTSPSGLINDNSRVASSPIATPSIRTTPSVVTPKPTPSGDSSVRSNSGEPSPSPKSSPTPIPPHLIFTVPSSDDQCFGGADLVTWFPVEESPGRELYRRFYNNWKTNPEIAYEAARQFVKEYPNEDCMKYAKRYIDEYERQVLRK